MIAALNRFDMPVVRRDRSRTDGGRQRSARDNIERMTSKDGEGAALWLEDQCGAMEETLGSLVRINSFTENVRGGNEVGERLRGLFVDAGLEVAVTPSE